MAIRKRTKRDEAFFVVNKTLTVFKRRLSKAFGWTIPVGAFDGIMNEVMTSLYPLKGTSKAGRSASK